MMTIAAYLIAAYPTREFDSGSWIGSCWSVNWSAPLFSFSHDVDREQLIGWDVIELKGARASDGSRQLSFAGNLLTKIVEGSCDASTLITAKQNRVRGGFR
jgi:hypothetical protein